MSVTRSASPAVPAEGDAARRVVITGIGMTTPLGRDRESTWQALLAGNSGLQWLPPFRPDSTERERPFAGAPAILDPSDSSDPTITLALRAASEAVAHAGLSRDQMEAERTGCVIGSSKGGFRSFASAWSQTREHGTFDPQELWSQFLSHAAASAVAKEFDLRGPLLTPVSACATGLTSVIRGAELVADGTCDLVLAGSSDASLCEPVLASYRRLGVLADGFKDPAEGCRPFDRRRTGFLIGEGAAVFVLESLTSAQRRGATIYAEWLAGGLASDLAGMARVEDEPRSLAWLITSVLRRAGVRPSQLDYINLHGTATRENDVSETQALKLALNEWAPQIPSSSLKGALGHLLGAAGSVELAATVLAMRDGVIPPTRNLQHADPACDLDYTPQAARPRAVRRALKLSLGFGGHLAAAVLCRHPTGR